MTQPADGFRRLPQSSDVVDLRDRHRDFYLDLARQIWKGEFSDDQEAWAEVARSELDNLRAAFEWSLDRGEADAAMDLAAAPVRVWVSGRRREGRSWLRRALALGHQDSAARAHALLASVAVATSAGDVREEEELIDPLLTTARAAGEDEVLCAAVFASTRRDLRSRDLEQAAAGCREAVEIARRLSNPRLVAQGLVQWGWVEANQGRWEEGRRLQEQAISETEGTSDITRGRTTLQYALYLHSAGEMEAAVPVYERACTLLERGGELPGLQAARQRVAEVLLDLGRTAEARRHLELVVAMGTEAEGGGDVAGALVALGEIAANEGDPLTAEKYVVEACDLLLAIEDRRFDAQLRLGEALAWRASLAELAGDHAGAIRWLELALTEGIPGSVHSPRAYRLLGAHALRLGDDAAAIKHFERALSDAGSADALAMVAPIQVGLAVARGDVRGAYDVAVEALDGTRDQPAWQRVTLFSLAAQLALRLGLHAEADDHGAGALAGPMASAARAALLLSRARARLGLGDPATAAALLAEIGPRWRVLWQGMTPVEHLRTWARLRVAQGRHERGVELLAVAERERERLQYVDREWTVREVEESIAAARGALGEEAFDRAWDRGLRLLPRDELAREAERAGA